MDEFGYLLTSGHSLGNFLSSNNRVIALCSSQQIDLDNNQSFEPADVCVDLRKLIRGLTSKIAHCNLLSPQKEQLVALIHEAFYLSLSGDLDSLKNLNIFLLELERNGLLQSVLISEKIQLLAEFAF